MSSANPILLPELRGMITEGDVQGLREVAQELHPATVAEFSEGLEPAEIWALLDSVPVDRQAEIFPYYPMPEQVALLETAERPKAGLLLESMASDNRDDVLRELDE